MRRKMLSLVACGTLAALGLWAATATGQALLQYAADEVAVTCTAGGATGTTVARGLYLLSATSEMIHYKWASSCGTGGTRLHTAESRLVQAPGGTLGATFCCRSSGATGVAGLSRVQYVKNPSP